MVSLLLHGAGKYVHSDDGEGATHVCTPLCSPLRVAVRHGQFAVAETLVAAGADVNILCGGMDVKISLLGQAIEDGQEDLWRMLIDNGADVHLADSWGGTTPLHIAAHQNDSRAIDALISAGAYLEAKDVVCGTPLHSAAYARGREAVAALLKHGAEVNAQAEETPLHLAAARGDSAVVDLLPRSGADESLVNGYGDIPGQRLPNLWHHLSRDEDRVRKLLANAKADKAWRRRGLFALCRSRPGKARPTGPSNHAECRTGTFAADFGNGGGSGIASVHWPFLVAWVLGLKEEGLFRMILGYV